MRAIRRRDNPLFRRRRIEMTKTMRAEVKLRNLILISLLALLSILGLFGTPAVGQTSKTGSSTPSSTPDLSGFWELKYDSENVPRASLTPTMAEADPDAQARRDATAIRWCNHVGMPFLMGVLSPLDIRQGRLEVAIASEAVSAARHIYITGVGHPNTDTYDPQSNGHSIGHWEGNTLVVDTVGFSDQGVTRIPGGGIRTPDSHLIERFRVLDGGKRLSVVFTWEDPKVFSKPHTYEFRYYKAPAGTYARELFCDASDAERAKFLMEPPQPVHSLNSR
jgi:hypothetical protein